MKHFPFGDIIKDAWKTTIHNTKLWWFGLFVGGGLSVNMPSSFDPSDFGGSDGNGESLGNFTAILQKIASNWGAILAVILFIVLFFFAIWVLVFICQAAVLLGLVKVKNGESYKFWNLFSLGAKKIFRLFLMAIIYGVPNVILLGLGALSVPWEQISISGIRWWLLIPVIGIMILYNIFISLFRHYSYCFAVIENQSGWQAIKSGFGLLKKDFGNVFVVALIYLGLSMAAMLGMMIVLLALCVPFVLLGLISIFLAKWLMIVVIVIGAIALLVAALAIRGAMGIYFQSYFTNAYWEFKK